MRTAHRLSRFAYAVGALLLAVTAAAAQAPAQGETATAPDGPSRPFEIIPEVVYDLDRLPQAVRETWQKIIDTATAGDIEALRPLIMAGSEPTVVSVDDVADPVAFLRSKSGDGMGREILAILIEVLEAGFIHTDAGTPDEMYVWPYFAGLPPDSLTPRQLVELFKLVYAGDYEDMLAHGYYTYFRAGIAPDGSWRFFVKEN
jgi:hypothetical protein